MKKFFIVTAIAMSFTAPVLATDTVGSIGRTNHVLIPANQVQASTQDSAIAGKSKKMTEMDQHQRAMITHGTMNNGTSYAHEQISERHKKMSENQAAKNVIGENIHPLSPTNEHKRTEIRGYTIIGHVSVHSKATPDDVVAGLAEKARDAGAPFFKVISVRGNNQLFGNAVLLQ